MTDEPSGQEDAEFLARYTGHLEELQHMDRGTLLADLLKILAVRVPPGYFQGASTEELAVELRWVLEFLDARSEGFRVRTRPTMPSRSRAGSPLAIESAGKDQPFLLDSLLELLRVQGLTVRQQVHPILAVTRDEDGRVRSVSTPRQGAELVSWIHLELADSLTEAQQSELRREAESVLQEARIVVDDFEPILERVQGIEDAYRDARGPGGGIHAASELDEWMEFLAWLRKGNFVFLGFGEFEFGESGGSTILAPRSTTGLGILRDSRRLASVSDWHAARALPGESDLGRVCKGEAESRVVRRTRMDLVLLKGARATEGRSVVYSILGLFTARAYNDLASDIPILRTKLAAILSRGNVVPGSHDHKEIFSIFTSTPKSELFASSTGQLADLIFAILSHSDQPGARVLYRLDAPQRGASVLVLIPRDRVSSSVRTAIQDMLAQEFQGNVADYRLALSDEPNARLHFYLVAREGVLASPSRPVLERRVCEIIRAWGERLADALARTVGTYSGAALGVRYLDAFSPSYVAQKSPEEGAADVQRVERVLASGETSALVAARPQARGETWSQLKIFSRGEPYPLSRLMPILAHLGLEVLDAETFRVVPGASSRGWIDTELACGDGSRPLPPQSSPAGAPADSARNETPLVSVFLHDFRVRGADGSPLGHPKSNGFLEEVIPRILRGDYDSDDLNALILRAGLDARQVGVLRAYSAYLLQLISPLTQRTAYSVFCQNPEVSRCLVEEFEARFDPRLEASERVAAFESAQGRFAEALAGVAGIHEDQLLRQTENLVRATVRTNHFVTKPADSTRRTLCLKIRCVDVESMPEPRPQFEIFTHSCGMEGVHLRSGKVARGGIRWSSRHDDYRTEIFELMRTQRKKNSVIVPVGAKGGFVLRGDFRASPPREQIEACYREFIGALLDVTDTIVEGRVLHPEGIVVHDENDPYLVVAADRGTATFSDIANEIAQSRGFWLGDAFASGGSLGFDHKKEGITARGAWECVRRHFWELGIDSHRDPFSVVGIGDMSGDVFGNGMLHSDKILLKAAFNHMHVFLDPIPDPSASFLERKRLFSMPRSSWGDYNRDILSDGGGIFPRDSKAIRLAPAAREMLELDRDVINGEELVRAVLRMRVDLLWNGGIGTYVKSRGESHRDVGDPASDAVRVDGVDVGARVVGEGGNLGFTQLGRIEYARAGGRINTDFIDNSGGVDMSDHEVNLKILLAIARTRGDIDEDARRRILESSIPDVTRRVLLANRLQAALLSVEERERAERLDDYRALLDELSATGLLSRESEDIPDDRELLRLGEAGSGLPRPVLAVLLAYAKIDAFSKVLQSPLVEDESLLTYLSGYFPNAVSVRFEELLVRHQLRREISATVAVNDVVHRMGIGFLHRVARRSSRGLEEVLRAYLVASTLARSGTFRAGLERLEESGTSDVEISQQLLLRFRAAEERVVAAVLRGRGDRTVRETTDELDRKLSPIRQALRRETESAMNGEASLVGLLGEAGVRCLIEAERAPQDLEIADLREVFASNRPPVHSFLHVWNQASALLSVDRIRAQAARIPRPTEEDALACDSLLDRLDDLRREVAQAILSRLLARGVDLSDETVCAIASTDLVGSRERGRMVEALERAESLSSMTPAGLYVLVATHGAQLARTLS